MRFDFMDLKIVSEEKLVSEIFASEIEKRTGKKPEILNSADENCVVLKIDETIEDKDFYSAELKENNVLEMTAKTVRGLIFAVGHFLRKTVYTDGKITLVKDFSGSYKPDKKIRGHQIGFRHINNTYDAWTPETARQYFIESMFYGCNIVELIPEDEGNPKEHNEIMPCTQNEFMYKCSEYADELDLDVSLWYPNDEREIEQSAELRKEVVSNLSRIDVIFPPGGDPGEYPADEFLDRCSKIIDKAREVKPSVEMWPSAQAPHSIANWGEAFIESIKALPDGKITGVIQGPNRAFDIDVLRRKLPEKYPIRLYPDITHNLRCEYSVHYPREDWHYSLASVNSREAINPRPSEFRRIHRQTRPYTVGSVSYSEGVNDDVNKVVWGMLEFDNNAELMEILEDYARLYFVGAPSRECAEAIMGLEKNWEGDCAENPVIDSTYDAFRKILEACPSLKNNWRYMMCVYRSMFDKLIKMRRIFENSLIEEASYQIRKHGNLNKALEILDCEYDEEYTKLYNEIFAVGDILFNLIGMQTSVERHYASHWERGAVLETIDRPVTNRKWFRKRVERALEKDNGVEYMLKVIDRNKVNSDETYFSFGEHGYEILGVPQKNGEPYINFMGDKPDNADGDIPMEMVKVYDHYSLNAKLGGFVSDCDYKLRITFHDKGEGSGKYTLKANDTIIYQGVRFGGERDEEYDEMMLAPGFISVSYILPKSVFVNGCLDLEITEEESGCEISEFSIRKIK